MLGGIIGGALGALGGIFGGISKNKMLKRMRNMINEQKRENQDWYDRRYNEDSTQRADAQAILTQTADMIRRRNQQSAGAQAVMGGTEESVAATKAANANALADTAAQIAVAGANRKDNIESQYITRKGAINDKLNNLQQQKANNIINAVNGVSSAASDIASSALG
jgi:hypothetical protein